MREHVTGILYNISTVKVSGLFPMCFIMLIIAVISDSLFMCFGYIYNL